TVADFLAKKDTATEYTLTGKITNVANTTYGNFDLTDATGSVYVYGLLTPEGASQKQWAAAGLKLGDIITIKGKYNLYNGSPQIKNAVYVSHKSIKLDNESLKFAAEGSSVDVTATLVNATDAISVSVDNSHFTVALKSGTTYTVTAPANETEETIYANLTFTAGELSAVVALSQEAKPVEGEVVGGRDDFSTVAANSGYGTRTTTNGWKGTNCAVMQGGSSDNNPTFTFIGSTNAIRAFTMNGKTSAKGKIVSPTLTTGCGKLSLKYGHAFSESKGVDFTITIKQNGSAVQTYKVDVNSITQKKAYTWEQDVNVAGDFVIEITNNSPSNSTSNKDRVSIWDIEWTGYAN
ncbi:MAG: BACON domain-containing protein, partial [Alistipes sp.]|nr:BACON domain-containing protein [Alistipes sp.]